MGRGLSELQKNILVIGHRSRGAGDDPHDEFDDGTDRMDVTFHDVLAEHFGWGFDETHYGDAVDEDRPMLFNHWKRRKSARFSRKVLGVKRYQTAMASICRAMQRLHDRGFVTYRKHEWGESGCQLTPWGMYQGYRLTTGRRCNKLTVKRQESPIDSAKLAKLLEEFESEFQDTAIG